MAPFQAGSPTGDTAAAGSPSGDTAGGATEAGSPSGDTALQVVLPGILQFAPSQTGSPTGDTVAAGSPSGDTAGGFSIKPASIIRPALHFLRRPAGILQESGRHALARGSAHSTVVIVAA